MVGLIPEAAPVMSEDPRISGAAIVTRNNRTVQPSPNEQVLKEDVEAEISLTYKRVSVDLGSTD